MEILPPGALLRDPRSPDLLDIRVVFADEKVVKVLIAGDTRLYSRTGTLLRRWLLPARTPVVIIPIAEHEASRTGVVIDRQTDADSAALWTYLVTTDRGTEEVPEQRLQVLRVESNDPVARLAL